MLQNPLYSEQKTKRIFFFKNGTDNHRKSYSEAIIPTPVTSKTHKLSYLDQIAPPIYIPLIFFYQNVQSKQHEEISRRLKQSLSEILTVYYPLAGTVHQNSHVDCNDRGAEFVEARVHARLSEFLQNPKMEETIKQLLPTATSSYDEAAVQLSAKASFFDCGGVSVGVCFPHKIGDLSSFATFMNSWAATCRGEEGSRSFQPYFDVALHFPPRDLPRASGYTLGMTGDGVATKRLVFDEAKIEKLLEELSGDGVKDPSREEAVSIFMWRSFIEAYKSRREAASSFAASHAVDLRPRAAPPLPATAIGNCFTSATAVVTSPAGDVSRGVLVSKLRAAMREVEEISYVDNKVLIEDGEESVRSSIGGLFKSENCYLSSWWRFPVKEVDFGWGKPGWVCTATMPFCNLVLFMEAPSGDGIEAWINGPDEEFFQIFVANYNKLL